MRLLPREEKFYALFARQVNIISEASRLLTDGMRAGATRLAMAATEIKSLEHSGDEIIHEIFTKLNQTFITPIDPEDIHSISSALDDVLDGLEEAAHRLVSYRIDPIPPDMIRLAEIISACSKTLLAAFGTLEKSARIMEHCIEVNRLENEGDLITRSAVADLFNQQEDPIALIKLKEVYECLEATIDSCEDVADLLQNVVVKSS
jgi:predicted phosphate transport protein (TIGR00153 family)